MNVSRARQSTFDVSRRGDVAKVQHRSELKKLEPSRRRFIIWNVDARHSQMWLGRIAVCGQSDHYDRICLDIDCP